MHIINHRCHAIGCKKECKPEFLMCPKHWYTVPKLIQVSVYKTYRKGQCDDMQVTPGYCQAASNAVIAVAIKEKRLPVGYKLKVEDMDSYLRLCIGKLEGVPYAY